MELDLSSLVGRQESDASLVRFEDATDTNTPRLNYSVPLPGAFNGKFYIETDYLNDAIPWTNAAREDRRKTKAINDFVSQTALGKNPALPKLSEVAVVPKNDSRKPGQPQPHFIGNMGNLTQSGGDEGSDDTGSRTVAHITPSFKTSDLKIAYGGSTIDFNEIVAKAGDRLAPVFYRSFGGTLHLDFVSEAENSDEANPRFIIVEHYKLSSFFGNYGAGRTVGVFSLMPGEETTLFIRNWQRTKETIKLASSIFDSYTDEAADEFELDVQAETTNTESESKGKQIHSAYSGSGEINLGIVKTKHSGERVKDTTQTKARENVTKNSSKVASKHSSKASSKRETEVTQELEATTEEETERVTERKIKNTNLSRTLNIVARELNQEFTTYFSLIDVTVAFVNDLGVLEIYQVHEIDEMIQKYIRETTTGGLADPNSPFGGQTPRAFVRERLLNQINEVYDFRGTQHDLLEEVEITDDGENIFAVGAAPSNSNSYIRVRRSRSADRLNPFYEPGVVPVEGVVMNESTHTVRTPAVIIDSLLGHGIALDNYGLGLQQEALREKQLQNRKVEVALDLIASGDTNTLEAYRQLFGSVDHELLRQIVLTPSD